MTNPTLAQYEAARARLKDDDFTKSGPPYMDAINGALDVDDLGPIDAADRDALEAEREAEIAAMDAAEPMDASLVTIFLESASTNPLPLYVHGVGGFNLRAGMEHTLPADAVSALRNTAGAKFTVKEADNG